MLGCVLDESLLLFPKGNVGLSSRKGGGGHCDVRAD
jgi:hypothetical protein